MKWNRREFMAASSLAVVGGSLRHVPLWAQQPQQPPVVPAFEALRRNVGTFTARGGTMGWFIGSDALLVVDSQFPDAAQMFLDGLKQRTTRRTIDVLVNTHYHLDHTGGNKVLRPSVAKIVAHATVPEWQKKQAAASKTEEAQAYPDATFKDTWKVDLGSEVVSAKHYGPGHTGGDIAIFFEKANIVHMGDLMFNHRHPRVDRPAGASIRNWITLLEKTVSEHGADTAYIFGHAKAGLPVTGTRADLLAFRDYFSVLLAFVQKAIAAGTSVAEISKTAELPGFPQHEGTALLTSSLQMAYEELTARP